MKTQQGMIQVIPVGQQRLIQGIPLTSTVPEQQEMQLLSDSSISKGFWNRDNAVVDGK